MSRIKLPSLTIFFPFFNDAGTVNLLVTQAYFFGKQITENLEVIAIHGGASKDSTLEEILKAKTKYPDLIVLDQSHNQEGYGVIRHGFHAATKEWVFYMDGDGQYHLEDLPKLVEKAFESGSDVVNGFKVQRSDPWFRVFLGKGYQVFCHLLFHLPIRDIDCDFRLIQRKHLHDVKFSGRGASILPELILILKQSGAKFSEVPIKHYPRVYGCSNYSSFNLFLEKLIGDFTLRAHWKKQSLVSSEATVFQNIHEVEEKLWWYVALRESILHEVEKISSKVLQPSICDVGCGTGSTMEFLQEKKYDVQGVDISSISLIYCMERGLKKVLQGSIVDLPLPKDSFDIVLVIDVLCMLEDVERLNAIQALKRVLRSGGELIINEPAFKWLRSQHDLSCRLKKRFRKKECIALLTAQGFEIKQASYRVCFLFPLIASVRLIKKFTFLFTLFPKSDMKTPSKLINWLSLTIQRCENILIKQGYNLPFGSSVFLIARKK